jgi:hypothetical protein
MRRGTFSLRRALSALLVAVALFCCTAASAGSLEIGVVAYGGIDRWTAGEPAEVPTGETACKPAKFNSASLCGNLVISNRSSQAITVTFKTGSEEFWADSLGGAGVGVWGRGNVPLPCSAMDHGHLQSGESCFEPVAFLPRTGDVRHGTIHVIVKSGGSSTNTDVKFVGTSNYPPELQAAEEVRQRHEAELKKIAHVASVELDNDDNDGIKINVTVMDEDDIEDVRRQVPPKIEGYDTEVTQYVDHGFAL